MTQHLVLSGLGGSELLGELTTAFHAARPRVVGIASAYISVIGIDMISRLRIEVPGARWRLVAGVDGAVSHPQALSQAQQMGWRVRVVRSHGGIFHPKLLVAGSNYTRQGEVVNPTVVYIGSANITQSGLENNTECGLVMRGRGCIQGFGSLFGQVWEMGQELTAEGLQQYAAEFARVDRARDVATKSALGLTDTVSLEELPNRRVRRQTLIHADRAIAVWAGLQTHTGGYRFQLEFPARAGEIIHAYLRRHPQPADHVPVLCSDGVVRPMIYRFYADNSMYRLNIPNEVPGVEWARENEEGIGLVELIHSHEAVMALKILRPGPELEEVVQRSYALGTWARTPTRSYGWY